ncbi:MAG: hydroxyphenylacetyl-CoA thioesterase PaaI [Gemmobacter sp.]|nr:hydroxyphenylacetyl-CoA thioesterase PaaI [Gemmobacter sp.]
MTDPQATATRSAAAMMQCDQAFHSLGLDLVHIAPGQATITMQVTPAMANAHGAGHGGYTYALADTAFGYASNSHGDAAVSQHCSITYLALVRIGDLLTATAHEIARQGRSGIYDVRITAQDGRVVAEFRGHSRIVPAPDTPAA